MEKTATLGIKTHVQRDLESECPEPAGHTNKEQFFVPREKLACSERAQALLAPHNPAPHPLPNKDTSGSIKPQARNQPVPLFFWWLCLTQAAPTTPGQKKAKISLHSEPGSGWRPATKRPAGFGEGGHKGHKQWVAWPCRRPFLEPEIDSCHAPWDHGLVCCAMWCAV